MYLLYYNEKSEERFVSFEVPNNESPLNSQAAQMWELNDPGKKDIFFHVKKVKFFKISYSHFIFF